MVAEWLTHVVGSTLARATEGRAVREPVHPTMNAMIHVGSELQANTIENHMVRVRQTYGCFGATPGGGGGRAAA